MSRRFPQDELLNLASQLIDGQLDDNQFDRLRELVAHDPISAAWLVDWMEQHVMLEVDLGNLEEGAVAARPLLGMGSEREGCGTGRASHAASMEQSSPKPQHGKPQRGKPRRGSGTSQLGTGIKSQTSVMRYWIAALAACLLVVVGYRWGWNAGTEANQSTGPPIVMHGRVPPRPAAYVAEVATILGGVDAQFDGGVGLGSRVGPGRLMLKKGMAQIAFDRGATVVLQGPAEMVILDDGSCRLVRGSLSADVPPETSGFSIAAGSIRVAERDAQFGVKTFPEAFTEVHAFGGELNLIDYRHPNDQQRRLAQGEALRWHAGKGVEGISPNPRAFITNDMFREAQLLQEQRSYDRWLDYSRHWMDDPSLLVRYEFNEVVDDAIPNSANASRHPAHSHQSPRLVRGRWTQKSAMLFDGRTDVLAVADRPELQLDGDLTLAVWMRTRSYPVQGWTRVVGKGQGCDRNYGLWMDHTGSMLWQVVSDVDPELQSDWDRHSLRTRPIPIEQWMLVAGVVENRQLKFYLNGVLQLSAPAPEKFALTNAPLVIGYYGNAPGHNQFFCGDIDELILLNRAMSQQELRRMFESGDPTNMEGMADDPNNTPSHNGVPLWGA